MDTRYKVDITPKDSAAGAVPELQTCGPITVFCIVVIGLSFGAPLLMTLPQMLDAAASPAPLISEVLQVGAGQSAAAVGPERTFHDAHSAQATRGWVDTLEDRELAVWRLRSSD
jgi:hypothetical protein